MYMSRTHFSQRYITNIVVELDIISGPQERAGSFIYLLAFAHGLWVDLCTFAAGTQWVLKIFVR